MAVTKFAPGCCCGSSCTKQFCFVTCAGAAVSGAAYTVTPHGGGTASSGTTDGTGCVTLTLGLGAGSYDVAVTYGGNTLTLTGQTLACGGNFTLTLNCFVVRGCIAALPGATVTITPGAGSSLTTTTFTTDGSGQACFPFGGSGWTYSIARSRFVTMTGTVVCATGTYDLTAAAGYHCTPCCNIPICDTLDFTDSQVGATTLTYSAGVWSGTMSYAYAAFCGCPAVTVPIGYFWPGSGGTVCNTIDISYPAGSGPSNICCGSGILNCPSTAGSGSTSNNGFTGSSTCDPLDFTATIAGCTCTTCAPLGTPFPKGCSGTCVGGLWNGTATFTITDAC